MLHPAFRFLLLLTVALCVVHARPCCASSTGDDDAGLRATIRELADEESAVRTAAIEKLTQMSDPRILAVLEHYQQSSLFLWEGQLVLCPEMKEDADGESIAPLQDVLTGAPILGDGGQQQEIPEIDLEGVFVPRRNRRALLNAIQIHELKAEDVRQRLAAVKRLGMSNNTDFIGALEDVLKADNPPDVRYFAEEGIWLLKLGDEEASRDSWMKAAHELASLQSYRGLTRLSDKVKEIDQLQVDGESADLELRDIYQQQVTSIQTYQDRVEITKNIFNGISTGSVLVLIALGLAIIFGQMGVINMAHGELVMLGAYATYVTQLLVGHTPEDPRNWFFLAALPISFLVAAFAGLLIEFLVVRHLYKRPLESLLATWGVGLILIQFIRAGFPWAGAEWASRLPGFLRWDGFGDNIGVNSPTWLMGAYEPMTDLALPYNRLFIIGLTIVSVMGIAIMMRYTRLGLRIRATVQNRETAATLGVNTRRTDSYTFAIGSGLAGIAGCALTLIAGVTPDMGQNYIVDSFLVVVTGGVGKLSGSVFAGTGIGVLNKFFEPISFGGALFSVGLFALVAAWIMIGVRARRLDRKQLLPALALPPLYIFQNRKQRGMGKLLLMASAGVVVMLLVSRSSFDHVVVIRGANSTLATAERLLVSDRDGTRKVILLSAAAETNESTEEGESTEAGESIEEAEVDAQFVTAREALKKAEGPFMEATRVVEEAEKNKKIADKAAESAEVAHIEAQEVVEDAKRAPAKTARVGEEDEKNDEITDKAAVIAVLARLEAQKVLEDAEQALAEAARVSEEAEKNKKIADKEATLAKAALMKPQKVFDDAKHPVAEHLARLIRAVGLQHLTVVADEDRVFLRGSRAVIFTSRQESLGLARKTPEGFRSKPAQIASRLPGFVNFLAIPVQTRWGKVLILIVAMLFIQWQPAGLFPPRGRLADE